MHPVDGHVTVSIPRHNFEFSVAGGEIFFYVSNGVLFIFINPNWQFIIKKMKIKFKS